jgi:putative oxidoreductase
MGVVSPSLTPTWNGSCEMSASDVLATATVEDAMRDLGFLLLRLVVGGLLAGHGAQKLFGWFGGPGPDGVAGWLESLGLHPGHFWARMAGVGEFGGGLLTALGLGGPVGPIMMLSTMVTAAVRGHWGKPIWATEGGAELPVTNMAVGTALALAGPGRYSLDRLFGIKIPGWLAFLFTLGALGTALYTSFAEPAEDEEAGQESATQRAAA